MARPHARPFARRLARSLGIAALLATAAGTLSVAAPSAAQPQGEPPAPSRGAMLYANHCIACHATQMHWREKRQAVDWATLRAQVQRWQGVARLDWSDEDVLDVVRHLNETIYHFAPPPDPRG
jgi:mono/diheme cytochrome c family protein